MSRAILEQLSLSGKMYSMQPSEAQVLIGHKLGWTVMRGPEKIKIRLERFKNLNNHHTALLIYRHVKGQTVTISK